VREESGIGLHKLLPLKSIHCDGFIRRKSCGDGRVATGTGRGYCRQYLVTDLHAGGLGVTVVSLSTGAKATFVSCLDARAALFRDSTALFHGRRG